jgi:hypothetical protein
MVKLVIGMATRNRFILKFARKTTDSNIHRLWQQNSLLGSLTLAEIKTHEILKKLLKVEK